MCDPAPQGLAARGETQPRERGLLCSPPTWASGRRGYLSCVPGHQIEPARWRGKRKVVVQWDGERGTDKGLAGRGGWFARGRSLGESNDVGFWTVSITWHRPRSICHASPGPSDQPPGWSPFPGPLHLYSLPSHQPARPHQHEHLTVKPPNTLKRSAPPLTYRIVSKFISQARTAPHDLTQRTSASRFAPDFKCARSNHRGCSAFRSHVLPLTPCFARAVPSVWNAIPPLPCIHLSKPFPWAPRSAFAVLSTLTWQFSFQTPLGILPGLI